MAKGIYPLYSCSGMTEQEVRKVNQNFLFLSISEFAIEPDGITIMKACYK